MEKHNNIIAVSARSAKQWRRWLEKNHLEESSAWLIIYHKSSAIKSIYYDEAVEQAICFGWIDSISHKRDNESKYQFFARRKPTSNWSRANRERAEKMIEAGLMKPTGQALIDFAKKTGSWDVLTDVQNAVIPMDLKKELDKNKVALKNFLGFSPSSKRIILEWILNAKRPETRQKRIEETAKLAADNIKANHYRQ